MDEAPLVAVPLAPERVEQGMHYWFWEPEFEVKTPQGWLPFELGATVGLEFRSELALLRVDDQIDRFASLGLKVVWHGCSLGARRSESLVRGRSHYNGERSHGVVTLGYDFQIFRPYPIIDN